MTQRHPQKRSLMQSFRIPRWVYWALCVSLPLLAGLSVLLWLVSQGAAAGDASVDGAMALGATLAIAALTYPAGCVGTLTALALMLGFDLLTPTEAIAIGVLVSAAAGHWQWYVFLPRRFAGTARPIGPASEAGAGATSGDHKPCAPALEP